MGLMDKFSDPSLFDSPVLWGQDGGIGYHDAHGHGHYIRRSDAFMGCICSDG